MTVVAVPEAPERLLGRTGGRRSQGVRLCLGMLRGALVGAHIGLVTAMGLALVGNGGVGAANAAIAGALVIVFFASGQAVQLLATEMADGTGMAMLMTSYLARIVALGAILVLAMSQQARLDAVFDRTNFFLGSMLALLGWLGGVLLTHSHQRVFVYDRDADDQFGGSR